MGAAGERQQHSARHSKALAAWLSLKRRRMTRTCPLMPLVYAHLHVGVGVGAEGKAGPQGGHEGIAPVRQTAAVVAVVRRRVKRTKTVPLAAAMAPATA